MASFKKPGAMTDVSYHTIIKKSDRTWKIIAFIPFLVSIGLLVALITIIHEVHIKGADKDGDKAGKSKGGAVDSKVCGEDESNANGNFVDLTEPEVPGPFHDLTTAELKKLRTFLENDPDIRAVRTTEDTHMGQSYIYMADLWVPHKADVLKFLDENGPQPPRQARVMMFRGDLDPPVVEEWICGPLPDVQHCQLLNIPNRRNPVEFESRPFNTMEFAKIGQYLQTIVDEKLSHILMESFGATFKGTGYNTDKLTFSPVPYGSGLHGKLNERYIWLWGLYNVPYPLLHPVDFAILLQTTGSDSLKWTVEKVWYAGSSYNSMEELVLQYEFGNITKATSSKPVYSYELYSSLEQRGRAYPTNPQRPPTQVEPDGKRFTVNQRKVEYMGWEFNFRMSSYSGPALFDIRFQGDRIAYEISLSEIAVFYSGHSPLSQITDYVDSAAMMGLRSKTLVPGGDCPEHSTLVNFTVMNQHDTEPGVYDAAFCLFEFNNGYPLRRHSSYGAPNGFYGGMLDSVLTLRSALAVGNYDYIVDFIFHQNGILETRFMSTGYILTNVYRQAERLYGFQVEDGILGNLHHHMFNLKADLDINGVSNRYETLDISGEKATIKWNGGQTYHQSKFKNTLKQSEKQALYHYNFDAPKYHIIHNNDERSAYDEKRAYRVHLSGMSKSLIPEGEGNEKVITWARNQMSVTRHKDHEFRASSVYAFYDTVEPVVDFSKFYGDNETIVDEDLVFWLTLGLHHIPHTEDLPVTPTAGNHLTAFFLPYNYFPECPSMGSRDAMYVSYKDERDPSKGVRLNRNGNTQDTCMLPISTLEKDLEENPDMVLETVKTRPTI